MTSPSSSATQPPVRASGQASVPLNHRRRRGLPASAAFGWLAAGWRDFLAAPLPSLAYGLAVFVLSVAVVGTLFTLGLDYILFPALAGFMVVGPLVAIGLYQKSRDLAAGRTPSLSRMVFVKAASGPQVGVVVGGLFAAFAFAVSTFAVPMLLAERTDAFTAMGTSISLTWNNLGVMLAWGAIVAVLTAFSIATGLIGLIVVFPVLGHGTWHSYTAIR
jgi:uncharacterized membrane protein